MRALRQAVDRHMERSRILCPEKEVSLADRWRFMRAYGAFPLAYTAVSEDGIQAFGDDRGFIAFAQKMGFTYALGEPYCAAADAPALIGDFVRAFRSPVFVATGAETARALVAQGYSANVFGYDTVLDLASHSFAGKDGKGIRYATNWLNSEGLKVEELPIEEVDAAAFEEIALAWRRSRVASRREMRFLNRQFERTTPPDVRRFFIRDAMGRPLACVSFDPAYRDGDVIGYLASAKRRDPEGSSYLDLAIMRHAIDTFREEGRETVWLGLSPLAPADDLALPQDRMVASILRWAWRSGYVNGRLFNVKGIASYKARFRGREVPQFLCFPKGFPIMRLVGLLRLMKLI